MSWKKITQADDNTHQNEHNWIDTIGVSYEPSRIDASTDHKSKHWDQIKKWTMEVLRHLPFTQLSAMDKTAHIYNDHPDIPETISTSDPILADRLMQEGHEAEHAIEPVKEWKRRTFHEHDSAESVETAKDYLDEIRKHLRSFIHS